MKISLNTIKKYLDFELPAVDKLVELINKSLGQVEGVEDLGVKYKDAVVVRVVGCEKHPNADKLSICKIDDGGVVQDVPRDESGYVQVVCGAPNARVGIFAVWLPPKSVVPASYYDLEQFILDAREIRGVMSQGMLAAADELAIGNDHSGIIELEDSDIAPESTIKRLESGQNFAKLFELDDIVIELENKMFTHRPDCFGQLGVARELAGIEHRKFEDPRWYCETLSSEAAESDMALKVYNEAGSSVPRFMTACMDNVRVAPSPFWLQAKLVTMGSKPINNVVDITNYVMLMTAQPLHAYDYDKLRPISEKVLGVRMAKAGEKATLLNGKTYELTEEDIVIVDGEGPIGLGGVMGGGNSEVSDTTTRVVLECATFDMYAIRKTSMRHGLFTDAVTRFNKGQSPLMSPYVLRETVRLMKELSGAVQVAETYDDLLKDDKIWRADLAVRPMLEPKVIEAGFINSRLGLKLDASEMMTLLTNVGFVCEDKGDGKFSYWSPAWRMDIQDPEDVVEEVGRLYGFDKLPRELPRRSITPAAKNPSFEVKQRIRDSLSRAGANEVLSYSFVHEKTMKKAEQDVSQAFQLSNALSPDLQYYRLNPLPSLLDKVHPNIKSGFGEFVLFEIGKGHDKTYPVDEDGLPTEQQSVELVYASKKAREGAPYYFARRYVEQLSLDLGFSVIFSPLPERLSGTYVDMFERNRTAVVSAYYMQSGEKVEFGEIGWVGELKALVRRNFKLPEYCAAATLDFYALEKLASNASRSSYRPLSRFPRVTQDISLKVPDTTSYEQVFEVASKVVSENSGNSDVKLAPLSIYQAEEDKGHKTITLRLEIASYEKTLTDAEVSKIIDAVAEAAKSKLSAERI